ncbi:hypothetical protein I7I51_07304 [Histoplasma capsulatum]|uniref:SP-RING-type domain-containing protein n=1 Tax=Ajellomyces capsulatus TaxID=5037 RepID=A0A8A1MQV7_AJECA|nr:predicted protein [Histoplasma mississippiense (nom. inval.)]EDN09885.1 predicted protein [Histoplasma mississippiense (nom. inval.)]QSS66447.1 hypothetical protein I7I51_07304 [Histoplasma capsulatum]
MSANYTPRSRAALPSRNTPNQQPRSSRSARLSDAHGGSSRRQDQSTRGTLLQPPPYQPQVAPFNASALYKLSQLPRFPRLAALQSRLTSAAQALTECAGMINDRLVDAKARQAKRAGMKRKAADVENEEVAERGDGEGDEASNKLVDLEKRVKTVTDQLEERMRKIIDAEVRTVSLTDGLIQVHRDAAMVVPAAPHAKRRKMRRRPGEENEDDEDEGESEGEEKLAVEEPLYIRNGGTCKVLRKELKEKKAQWKGTSLTDRYTTNDKYIGFYRIVHESKYPGDEIPPLPHPSTWFADVEQPTTASLSEVTTTNATGSTNGGNAGSTVDDSDDLAIHSERASLCCPITLLPFTEPVKSKKCPHSFERRAIVAMIERSKKRIVIPANGTNGAGPAGKRVGCVDCPICSVPISMHDLEVDVVAVRRLRRAEERRRMEEEEEGGEDREEEDVYGDDDGVGIALGSVGRMGKGKAKGRAEVKAEREQGTQREGSRELSVVPDTQMVDLA